MTDLSSMEAEEILAQDPVEALENARAEVGRIDLSPCERARAWEELAQACRVLGDYARADACYERAEELCTCRICRPRRHRRIACSPLAPEEREALLNAFLSVCRWTRVYFLWRPNLPDEADNQVVELAVAGGAEVIVTRDTRDFLQAELHFPGLRVLRPEELIQELK